MYTLPVWQLSTCYIECCGVVALGSCVSAGSMCASTLAICNSYLFLSALKMLSCLIHCMYCCRFHVYQYVMYTLAMWNSYLFVSALDIFVVVLAGLISIFSARRSQKAIEKVCLLFHTSRSQCVVIGNILIMFCTLNCSAISIKMYTPDLFEKPKQWNTWLTIVESSSINAQTNASPSHKLFEVVCQLWLQLGVEWHAVFVCAVATVLVLGPHLRVWHWCVVVSCWYHVGILRHQTQDQDTQAQDN